MTDRVLAAERLLADCRLWGAAALFSLLLFLSLTTVFYFTEGGGLLFLFGILVTGFICLGATSLCRHSLVRLKLHIGVKISTAEFIATQFVVLLPLIYLRVKGEVAGFREKMGSNPGEEA